MIKMFVFYFICLFLLNSCENSPETGDLVLARVGSEKLFFKDLPKNIISPDIDRNKISFFVDSWVNEQVLFKSAEKEGFLNDLHLRDKRDDYYRKIIISSYTKTKTKGLSKITKEDVLRFYNNNKSSFIRKEPSFFTRHFAVEDLSIAKKIKKELLKTERGFNIDIYLKGSGYVEKNSLPKTLNDLLFNTEETIVGPVYFDKKNHVYEKISYYKKGSFLGIEDVYDEILQRLIKKEEISRSLSLLDSLKRKDNVFINLKY